MILDMLQCFIYAKSRNPILDKKSKVHVSATNIAPTILIPATPCLPVSVFLLCFSVKSYFCDINLVFFSSDLDECSDPTLNDCDEMATCKNTLGSYECACNPGHQGNGKDCKGLFINILLCRV